MIEITIGSIDRLPCRLYIDSREKVVPVIPAIYFFTCFYIKNANF